MPKTPRDPSGPAHSFPLTLSPRHANKLRALASELGVSCGVIVERLLDRAQAPKERAK